MPTRWHEALTAPDIKQQVVARFGDDILDDQGDIVRKRLGKKVFADRIALRSLEPALRQSNLRGCAPGDAGRPFAPAARLGRGTTRCPGSRPVPLAEKKRRADAVLENAGTPESLAGKIAALMARWKLT